MTRRIRGILRGKPTEEGAGVHLKRAFGHAHAPRLDPFLLFDDFHSSDPAKYLPGFPWHPHRGIETITYVLHGEVEHGDSMGNRGVISPGDVQWMTAGSGIIHQEMPKGEKGSNLLWGFQLWANLPARHKMMDPRYRDVRKETVPEVTLASGAKARVICGTIGGVAGAGRFDEGGDPKAYEVEGANWFDIRRGPDVRTESLVVYGDGEGIEVAAGGEGVRFLLFSGRPIGEPVAWYGPIVMNTREELETAFDEYERGTFIKRTAANRKAPKG